MRVAIGVGQNSENDSKQREVQTFHNIRSPRRHKLVEGQEAEKPS